MSRLLDANKRGLHSVSGSDAHNVADSGDNLGDIDADVVTNSIVDSEVNDYKPPVVVDFSPQTEWQTSGLHFLNISWEVLLPPCFLLSKELFPTLSRMLVREEALDSR